MGTDRQRLRLAALVFTVGFLAHNGDHARRGLDDLTDHVIWSGTTVAVVAAVVLTLIATGHRQAPAAALAGGTAIAAGVAASHLLPRWSAFSAPLAGASTDAATWVAVFAEIVGAIALAAAGGRALGPTADSRSTT